MVATGATAVVADHDLVAIGLVHLREGAAVGDVARFHDPIFGEHRRIEHWSNANYQGAEVGKILNEKPHFEPLPPGSKDHFTFQIPMPMLPRYAKVEVLPWVANP